MELISWNIQWGRGCDGTVNLPRIVDTLRGIADFDVLCLQEVTRGFSGMPGQPGADQVEELAALLPGFRLLFAAGVDRLDDDGKPRQFGNIIATRLPVREIFRHMLPWPADPTVASMPRVALEATVLADTLPLRIVCTHLEYYSAPQRNAQADALRQLHAQACGHALRPPRAETRFGPFTPEPRPASAIVCGDFNSKPEDHAYRRLLEPFDDGTLALRDAWLHAHPGQPHAPTCGIHDKAQWPGPAFACDFMLVTEDLLPRVRRCEVNADTQASDHQPIHLSLRDDTGQTG
ncbi:endonuclease/exonuclease/phosphatase family metal-dependent hydrolase [Cupriavidus gilardii J11]|uniref:Endonuclease/exonuclease/phosphatase family metal-dependent hydrolase n=1 Tax=Cupriavidus gilardii J11 TaxID=936133 RepID=A0A562BP98_9BURK|nr:endonuclease/exonuclease/phosphatase family protein [Cupriavidus gilardii]TWG86643.1 endonuclease/exonuclease/phosphatase family metal-dependent hydrolase [Cupriavidus gilardii J11]